MRNGKSVTQSRESAFGEVLKNRASRNAKRSVDFFRARISSIVALTDSLIASKAGKFLPAAVFATSLAATSQLWKMEEENTARMFSSAVETHVAEIENSVNQRMRWYEHILLGVRGFVDASEHVSAEEFKQFVESLRLHERYPEVRGIGISQYAAPRSKSVLGAFFSAHRSERDVPRPLISSAECAPIVMIEPSNRNNDQLVGFDSFTNPELRRIMEQSRDSDSAKISGIIDLKNEGSEGGSKGVVMYLPVFAPRSMHESVAERRENVTWWVALAFSANDFMSETLRSRSSFLWIEFFDGTEERPESMLFDSSEKELHDNPPHGIKITKTIKSFDRDWTLVAYPRPEFESAANLARSKTVLGLGIAASSALAFFVWLLIRGRSNVVAALNAMAKSAKSLRKSEGQYRALFENSKVPMLVLDANDGTLLDANAEAAEFYGYGEIPLKGMDISAINTADQSTIEQRIRRIRDGDLGRYESEHRLASGEIRSVEISASKIEIDGTERILQIVTDITERKNAVERILQMATHDELTGLPNRNLFMDRLGRAFASADRNGKMVSLMFVDLDQFKAVNDTIGHDVWDELLKLVAERMNSIVRAQDTVARQGWDEFLIVLPDVSDYVAASVVAEKLISVVSRPFVVRGHEIHIGASVWIAMYPKDSRDAETLMKYGDIAMYQVKESGRSSYRFFSSEMQEASIEKQRLLNALHHAIERKETSVEYQKIIDVGSGKIVWMEALLRWKHDEYGSVSPMKFIPIAEESGLIVPMGEWVIREVCQKIADWQAAGAEVPRVAINLSARQFRLKSLVDDVSKILKETGVAPEYVGLEITESMLVEDIEEVVATLQKLSDLGLEVSIDDFGTGYSSLSYLKKFPVKKLKIDRSFVRDIADDPDDVVIVQSIIDLAHNLDLRVVAEGVETEQQLSMLREMGCDCAQWYLFGRPAGAFIVENSFMVRK